DPRKDVTFLYSGQRNEPYGEVLPDNLPRPYWNKKVYTNPTLRSRYGSRYGDWFNVRLIRYADVVLLAAEAANEVGGNTNIELELYSCDCDRTLSRGWMDTFLTAVITRDEVAARKSIQQGSEVGIGDENWRFFDLIGLGN